MNLFKNIAKVCASGLFFSLPIYAETVSADKVTPVKSMFPNAYSDIMFRNYQNREAGSSKKFKGKWHARYTLGSTFFDEFMDTRVVLGAYKSDNSTVLTDRGTRIENYFNVYSNGFFEFTPFVEVRFPKTGDNNTKILAGISQELNHTFETSYGNFKFGLGHSINANWGTKADRVKLTANGKVLTDTENLSSSARTEFNLREEDGSVMADQRAATLDQEFLLGFKWEPNFLKGLSFQVKRYMDQIYTPKMEYNKSNNSVSVVRSGFLNLPSYDTTSDNWNRLGVAYEFSGSSWVSCDAYMSDHREYSIVSSVGTKLF